MVTGVSDCPRRHYLQVLLHLRGIQSLCHLANYLVYVQGTYAAKLSGHILTSLKETKQLSLEEIDLLFGERALGTLPDDLTDKQQQIELERVDAARKQLASKTVTAVH